jgi:hypothetical protein
MSVTQKLKREIVALAFLTFYFGCWLGVFVLIKHLLLAEYQIAAYGLSVALVGTLVLAKVVLVLEYVPLGRWIQDKPAWVDVVLRTALYAICVFLILLIEHTFEGRHEYGGFGPSLTTLFRHADINHVWLNIICLTGTLLSYNMFSVVRKRLGKGVLLQMFLTPLPEGSGDT